VAPSSSRLPAALVALAAGALVALGVPFGELWRACRAPTSEACVWGKALLPVSLGVGVVLGIAAAAVAYAVVRAWQRRQAAHDGTADDGTADGGTTNDQRRQARNPLP
jgi:hypothetical protein